MGRKVYYGGTEIEHILMKIAVTGATGFIGRHVLSELALHDVMVCAISQSAGDDLPILKRGEWLQVDIGNPPANPYEAVGSPDVLIHLAWSGLQDYNSLTHYENELPLQYQFLKQLVSHGLENLVVTGTCLEYGMQSGPLSADMATSPCTPYGYAKDTLRRQLDFLKQSHPFFLTWARLFFMYGDGQSASSLFSQLKHAAEKGDRVFNMSNGEQLRDYLPVEDVAQQIVAYALKQGDYGAVNICSGKPISVRAIVEKWIKENEWDISLNRGYYAYPDYEPMAFWGIPVRNVGN